MLLSSLDMVIEGLCAMYYTTWSHLYRCYILQMSLTKPADVPSDGSGSHQPVHFSTNYPICPPVTTTPAPICSRVHKRCIARLYLTPTDAESSHSL